MNSYIVKAAIGALGAAGIALISGSIGAEASTALSTTCIGTSFMNGLSAQHIITTDSDVNPTAQLPDAVKQLIESFDEVTPAEPQLSSDFVTSDAISVSVKNLSDYSEGTIFNVYVNGILNKTVTLEELQKENIISVYNSSNEYFQPDTAYRVAVEPQLGLLKNRSQLPVTTGSDTYFRVDSGTLVYAKAGDNFYAARYTEYVCGSKGELSDTEGDAVAGQSADTDAEYIKLTEGEYSGLYVKSENLERVTESDSAELTEQGEKDKEKAIAEAKKAAEEQAKKEAEAKKKSEEARKAAEAKLAKEAKKVEENRKAAEETGNTNTGTTAKTDNSQSTATQPETKTDDSSSASTAQTDRAALIKKLCDYARTFDGGVYISCGTGYRACDCCGLTMLAYKYIGVTLPHSVGGQASMGKRVSVSEMQPGDIIIANGYGHAMLYLGDGYLIHAMNPRQGIKIQKASTAMYYNPVNCVVRII